MVGRFGPMAKPLSESQSARRMIEAGASPDFTDPKLEGRRLFAEAWGTFLTVMVTLGGLMALAISHGQISYGMAKLASGLAVTAAIYFLGSVSGAHINPVVTLAFAARGNFPWIRVPGYLIAQIVGGLAAAYLLAGLLGGAGNLGASTPTHVSPMAALALEIVLTAGLVNTILGTASGARNVGPNGALAVGFYVALAGIWAGPLEGASMNPIRSLAPDLARGDLSTTWIYIVGPTLGALIGVAFQWLLKGGPSAEGTRTAQGELEKD
ncbi:MAG: MIP/aquaporin family protein [Caulobacteraceae bacterium]